MGSDSEKEWQYRLMTLMSEQPAVAESSMTTCLENQENLGSTVEFGSCQENVRELMKSWGNVRGEMLSGKVVIVNFTLRATLILSSIISA